MNRFLICVLCVLFASCHENDQRSNVQSDSGLTTPAEIVSDTGGGNQPAEKWYGMESDDDTVIYEADGKILNQGIITGTFYRMDRGDFMHYVVLDSNGYLHSFFLNTGNQRQMDLYWQGYEPARGHPVTVKWIRGRLAISESGVMMTVYQAKEIIE